MRAIVCDLSSTVREEPRIEQPMEPRIEHPMEPRIEHPMELSMEQSAAQASEQRGTLSDYLSLLRIKQWIKNGFVLCPLILLFRLPSMAQFGKAFLAMILFCLISSSVYIVNDIIDLKSDRLHPTKRFRPIASNRVSKWVALLVCGILAAISITGAFLMQEEMGRIILSYFLINLAYSLKLKQYAFIDVFVIAFGFVLRTVSGMIVLNLSIDEGQNVWFLLFVAFAMLFIGMGKRRNELCVMNEKSGEFRKSLENLSVGLLDQITMILMTCTIMAYVMFVSNIKVTIAYVTIALVLYAIFRYQIIQRNDGKEELSGKPDAILYADRSIRVCVVLWALAFLGIGILK